MSFRSIKLAAVLISMALYSLFSNALAQSSYAKSRLTYLYSVLDNAKRTGDVDVYMSILSSDFKFEGPHGMLMDREQYKTTEFPGRSDPAATSSLPPGSRMIGTIRHYKPEFSTHGKNIVVVIRVKQTVFIVDSKGRKVKLSNDEFRVRDIWVMEGKQFKIKRRKMLPLIDVPKFDLSTLARPKKSHN